MAPMTLSHNNTLHLVASNGTVILVQGVDSSWTMDLNTLITIVFGVIGIAFQAGHMYHGRTQRTIKSTNEDVESLSSGGERLPHRQGSSSNPWHSSYYWDGSQEFEKPEPGLPRTASATPLRGVAHRRAVQNSHGMQLGTRNLPEGHVYRRNPWRSNEWVSGTNQWRAPPGPPLQRQYTQGLRPGFV